MTHPAAAPPTPQPTPPHSVPSQAPAQPPPTQQQAPSPAVANATPAAPPPTESAPPTTSEATPSTHAPTPNAPNPAPPADGANDPSSVPSSTDQPSTPTPSEPATPNPQSAASPGQAGAPPPPQPHQAPPGQPPYGAGYPPQAAGQMPPGHQPGAPPPGVAGAPHPHKPAPGPPGPMPPQYTNTPRYTQENLASMQRALQQLQAQGKMHDPRYHQLVNAVRQAEAQIRRSHHSTFTPSQLGQLRAQIMAYKQLSRTQHIDPNLLNAVKGNIRPQMPVPGAAPTPTPASAAGQPTSGAAGAHPPAAPSGTVPAATSAASTAIAKTEPMVSDTGQPTPPTSTPSTNQSNPPTPGPGVESRPSTAPPDKDESDKENKGEVKQEGEEESQPETPKALWTESPLPERSNDLAELLKEKRPGFGQHKITPVQKPKGIDPGIILEEGERRINARISNRIHEIEGLPADLPGELRVRAEIELRSLRLLGFQRQLRQDVMGVLRRDTTLETALNTKAYRRPKRQTLKEARITEKIEKQHKTEGNTGSV